ncbi:hypothetical protein M8J77_001721 [Diaphorina citri]|nr:hypothetical protein M8J77_001721 [Diaphorina citri]
MAVLLEEQCEKTIFWKGNLAEDIYTPEYEIEDLCFKLPWFLILTGQHQELQLKTNASSCMEYKHSSV